MKPFTINYVNNNVDSIIYRINGKEYEMDAKELTCKIWNEQYNTNSSYLSNQIEKHIAPDLNDIPDKTDFPYQIIDDWINSAEIKQFANRLQNEIFFDEASTKYSINSHCLEFFQDNCLDVDKVKESYLLQLYLYYSPYQFALISHLSKLLEELRTILKKKRNIESNGLLEDLYLESDEFIQHFFEELLKEYIPNVISKNQFQINNDNLESHLADYLFNHTLFTDISSPHTSSYYRIGETNFYHSYIQDNQEEFNKYLKTKLSTYVKENNYSFETTKNSVDSSMLNTFFAENFYSPEETGCVTNYKLNKDSFLISYKNYNTNEETIKKISTKDIYDIYMPAPSPNPYEIEEEEFEGSIFRYVKSPISPENFIYYFYKLNGGTFFIPLSLNIDIQKLFKDIGKKYNYNLYDELEEFYNKCNTSDTSYIHTGSLDLVISALTDATYKTNNRKIEMCEICGRFFITQNNGKYCCDGCKNHKKFLDAHKRDPFIIKIQNKRREAERIYVNHESNYYTTTEQTYERYNCNAKESLFSKRKADIIEEYKKFISYIRRIILLDIYDANKRTIVNEIKKTTGIIKEEIYNYGCSFFPKTNDIVEQLPSDGSSTYKFFTPSKEFKDNYPQFEYYFDWNIWLDKIVNTTYDESINRLPIMQEIYDGFCNWLDKTLTYEKYSSLPIEIQESIDYLSSFDEKLYELLIDSNTYKEL